MIPLPGETGGDWWTVTGQRSAREAYWESAGIVGDPTDETVMFFHDVPAELTATALAQPIAQSERPFAEPWPLASWPDVPTRVVVGRDDRVFPAAFQRRIAQERLGLVPDEIPGGHLLALSRPAGLADLLEDYLGSLRR
jgi:pimeloyl-ACP methyl ester carboxylesterase